MPKVKTEKEVLRIVDCDFFRAKACYDPERALGEDWSGTILHILRNEDISAKDRIWAFCHKGVIGEKLQRLFAVRCVYKTPISNTKKVFDLLTDKRSKNVLVIAEKYAHGQATIEELRDAYAAASAASASAFGSACASAFASDATAYAAAADAASASAFTSTCASDATAYAAAAYTAADVDFAAASYAVAKKAQVKIAIELIQEYCTEHKKH